MYEKPRLIHVGQAQEIILGMGLSGNDLDGTWSGSDGGNLIEDPEFAADSE
jgi:hypothetical protein